MYIGVSKFFTRSLIPDRKDFFKSSFCSHSPYVDNTRCGDGMTVEEYTYSSGLDFFEIRKYLLRRLRVRLGRRVPVSWIFTVVDVSFESCDGDDTRLVFTMSTENEWCPPVEYTNQGWNCTGNEKVLKRTNERDPEITRKEYESLSSARVYFVRRCTSITRHWRNQRETEGKTSGLKGSALLYVNTTLLLPDWLFSRLVKSISFSIIWSSLIVVFFFVPKGRILYYRNLYSYDNFIIIL